MNINASDRPELPPTDTQRWTNHRKAAVVRAIAVGMVSATEACERYGLSSAELTEWVLAYETGGVEALKVTRRKVSSAG